MSSNNELSFICDDTGTRQSLVLPMDTLRKLMESFYDAPVDRDADWSKGASTDDFLLFIERILEDYVDIKTVEERRNEPAIPFDEFVAQLKRDGKL